MIVKNETPVITRCLDSLKGFIDSWIIVDTGSTDGTQDLIRKHLIDLPGELIERPWVNFAHNRTEALEYAKGKADYVFIIDADETLEFEEGFFIPQLIHDAYNFSIESGSCTYYKMQLVNNQLAWSYKNIVHEYIFSAEQSNEAILQGVKTLRFPDGARARDPYTYRKDAELLKKALEEEPDNSRYIFYLAQSYRDANEYPLAIEYYEKRVAAGGWNEEVWYSLYQIAQLKERMNVAWGEVLPAYLAAYQFKPDRAGPLYRIGIHYQGVREFQNAFLFFKQAMDIPYPSQDRLFIEKTIYEYLLPLEYAVAAYYVGRHDEAIRVNNELLNSNKLPPELIERIVDNRRFSLDIYNPRKPQISPSQHITVVIPFYNPSTDFDNLIDTLLAQDYQHCSFLFIDNGNIENPSSRIALDDKRFILISKEQRTNWAVIAEEIINETQSTILLFLYDRMWMDSYDSLTKLAHCFAAYDCDLVYGQSRLLSGAIGKAMPFANEQQAIQELISTESVFPIAVRSEMAKKLPAFQSNHEFIRALVRNCPFHKQHFNDVPLVILNDKEFSYDVDKLIQPATGKQAYKM